MFARFDENPPMTLEDIKETKRYGRTHGQRENSIHTTNKVCGGEYKLEDLKVLRRSPDLLNNAKIVQGQQQLILFYHIWRLKPFWLSDLNNLMNNPSNSPVISAKKMFR